ncbi:MAG: hypothetical protein R3E98_14890 [Gemmatimonadota bacterium]|nr:hypothetical protein [Gemmatimonadota bacterium]
MRRLFPLALASLIATSACSAAGGPRPDPERLRGVLARLHEDVRTNRDRARAAADTVSAQQAVAAHLIDWFEEETLASSTRMLEELVFLGRGSSYPPYRIGYDALVLSGDVGQIPDGELRGRLAGFYAEASRLAEAGPQTTHHLVERLDAVAPTGFWYQIFRLEPHRTVPSDFRKSLQVLDEAGLERSLRVAIRDLERYRAALLAHAAQADTLVTLLEAARPTQ